MPKHPKLTEVSRQRTNFYDLIPSTALQRFMAQSLTAYASRGAYPFDVQPAPNA